MKDKALITTITFLLALFLVPAASLALPDRELSDIERRPLAQKMTYADYLETNYGGDLAGFLAYQETYLLDQFPWREDLRVLTALTRVYALGQGDIGGYYKVGGHLSKLDSRIREEAVRRAAALFNEVKREYFKGKGQAVFALIPDKNAFTAPLAAYPHYSYEAFADLLWQSLDPELDTLSLLEDLSLDHYYRSDPHWDQTKLLPIAEKLLEALGHKGSLDSRGLDINCLDNFQGTYAGQAGLPVEADSLCWFSGGNLDRVRVQDPVTGETTGLYQLEKAEGSDPYDLFLGGARPLLKISNPDQANGRQLVIFRDSFASALIPLLLSPYSEVLVLDLRYITREAASEVLSVQEEADLLFLFSTSVLNSPGAFLN